MSTRKKLVEARHSVYRWIGNNKENSLQQKKIEKVSRVTEKFLHLSILEFGHYGSPDRPNRVKLRLCANRINTEGLTVNVKHLSLSMQYVRTKLADGVLALKGVNSADNCADIFTKFVDHKTFDRQLDILNLRETKRKKEPGKSEDGSGSSASGESAALVEMAPSGGLSLDIDK